MELSKMRMRFVDINGGTLLDKSLVGIPLKGDVIIRKSIEFFNDPEPCMIHRSAVMKRLFVEICEYFESCMCGNGSGMPWNEVKEPLKGYFDVKGDIDRIIVYLSR